MLAAVPVPAMDFYPRSPRGERRTAAKKSFWYFAFLSTLPARGATDLGAVAGDVAAISIHAPREGSDKVILPAS